MLHYKYLVIGGGMTADAAARAIRKLDPNGTVGLVSAESVAPYNRPPLSKGLWKKKKLESIWRRTEDVGVTLHLGQTINALDLPNKRAIGDLGQAYGFDKLLLATGARPRRLHFGTDQIIYFRTLHDYERLRALAETGSRFAVIGGGFIGSEIAAALAMNGKQVVMIFPDEGIGGQMFPRELALSMNDFYRKKGVDVWAQDSLTGLEKHGALYTIETEKKQTAKVDGVIAGIGVRPNIELAEAAGLTIENGIAVDEFLRTSHPDVYAAGDTASFYNPALGKRIRVEHEDNANNMGECAGLSMAGEPVPYHYLPSFYSDLFELGYEAVGELSMRFETVADWKEPYREGVVYYIKDGRVRGVLLWNVWKQVDAARHLIAEAGPFYLEDLKGRLPATVAEKV